MGVLGVTVATMFVIFPNVGSPVLASEATDQIRAAIDKADHDQTLPYTEWPTCMSPTRSSRIAARTA